MNQRLLKNGENINSQDITLFCFPFAGGGASTYTSWIKKLKDKITVCPIQLPGREERIMEKPYTDMSELLRDLTDEIVIAIKGKYVLWGHSMGGKIAYELEKYLENKGYQAQCIFASGCRIPNIPEPNPIYHLKDEAFKRELERFGGTPKKVLENKELLDFFLPMLRADFTLADTYCDNSMTVLHSPNIKLFFQYWSAKEAYLKALGIGLGNGMDFFSVKGNVIEENGIIKHEWKLIPITIKNYAAYVAVHEGDQL